MRWASVSALVALAIFSTACAGLSVPFAEDLTGEEYRLGRWMFESRRSEKNSECLAFATLTLVAEGLERRHLEYIRDPGNVVPLAKEAFVDALGPECKSRLVGLSTDQVKFELFGSIQNIPEPDRLQLLGGILLEYEDVATDSGLRPTFHLEQITNGPRRRLVAVYRLENNLIIHLNYSGTDNVDGKSIQWPVLEFFGFVMKQAADSVPVP